MVTVRDIKEMFGRDVFTDRGLYCGKINDLHIDLDKFRLKSLEIESVKGSFLSSLVGSKKGVIVPFQMIEAIGDIVIIKHIKGPIESGEDMASESEG